jgi:nitrogen fixation protein NifU and related proteins
MNEPNRDTPPLSSLFQDVILDHYKRPRNRGPMDEPDAVVHMNNPTCGDEVVLRLKLKDNHIEDARFEGVGCSISQASISMMTQLIKGKTAGEAVVISRRFTEMLHGDQAAARDKQLGDLRVLAGVSKFAARVKCALLGFNALEEALKEQDSASE